MQTIVVRTDIPLPESGQGRAFLKTREKGPIRLELEKLEVGHSLILPGSYKKAMKMASTAAAVRKEFPGRTFAFRKIQHAGEDRCGVWRTA